MNACMHIICHWPELWLTQPSITPGSVNEYQLRLGRQRHVWFIPLADERGVCCVQVKLWNPLRTRAIFERLRGVLTTRRYANPRLPLPLTERLFWNWRQVGMLCSKLLALSTHRAVLWGPIFKKS